DGKVIVDYGGPVSANAEPSLAVQGDKIVVSSTVDFDGTGSDIALVRLNGDGGLDATFAAGGKRFIHLGGTEGAQSVTVLPDGKILVAGFGDAVAGDGRSHSLVVRLNGDGGLDTTFDGDGVSIVTPEMRAWVNAMAVQADGKIVLAGGSGSIDSPIAVRLNDD